MLGILQFSGEDWKKEARPYWFSGQ